MLNPPSYRFMIFPKCLPSVKFHIVGNGRTSKRPRRGLKQPPISDWLKGSYISGFAWTQLDPPMYWFMFPGCLPTLVLKFVRYRAFIVFNKDPYFKFVTINLIDYRTHSNLSLKNKSLVTQSRRFTIRKFISSVISYLQVFIRLCGIKSSNLLVFPKIP